MSKDKKVVDTQAVVAPEMTVPDMSQFKAPTEKLSDLDKLTLDLAKQRRQTVLAEAKTALAQNESAELAFKYIVLQIYMKYGLSEADAISENGEIVRGGALQAQQANQAPQGQ